jgi:DnaJ like chaperone protein
MIMGYWGKLFGGFAGLMFGGPLGALLGAAAGHAFDRMQTGEPLDAFAPPPGAAFGPHASRSTREAAFSIAVIVLGAKMAKVDGVVTRAEIDAFKQVFRVPPAEMKNVARIFDAAKRDAQGFEPYARQMAILFRNEPAILEELLGGLFHIARSDGDVSQAKLAFLRKVADIFGFDHRHFARVRDRFLPAPATNPYDVLGLARTARDDEIKRAYRRLIREHHPDTLIARGLPREFAEQANAKMAAINAAYDEICRQRGLA